MDLYGFLWIIVWKLYEICMHLFVCIFFYGYLFGGLEYLFVCIEDLLVWLWSSIEERFV